MGPQLQAQDTMVCTKVGSDKGGSSTKVYLCEGGPTNYKHGIQRWALKKVDPAKSGPLKSGSLQKSALKKVGPDKSGPLKSGF